MLSYKGVNPGIDLLQGVVRGVTEATGASLQPAGLRHGFSLLVQQHLDVLYHDVVSKAVRLQVSFDVFQFREGNPHVHREAGPGWAAPEVHPVKFIWPKAAARIKLQTRSVRLPTGYNLRITPPPGELCMLLPPGELQGFSSHTGMARPQDSRAQTVEPTEPTWY